MQLDLGTELGTTELLSAVHISLHIEKERLLLETTSLQLNHMNKQTFYKVCVRVLNQKKEEEKKNYRHTELKIFGEAPKCRCRINLQYNVRLKKNKNKKIKK